MPYLIRIQGVEQGPLTLDELYTLWSQGKLPGDTEVIYDYEPWQLATPLERSPILMELLHNRAEGETQKKLRDQLREATQPDGQSLTERQLLALMVTELQRQTRQGERIHSRLKVIIFLLVLPYILWLIGLKLGIFTLPYRY